MAETRQISTQTISNTIGSDISIKTFYTEETIDLLEVMIANDYGSESGTSYLEGEGVAYFVSNTIEDLQVNSNGELILISSDSDNYSINSNGELILTD